MSGEMMKEMRRMKVEEGVKRMSLWSLDHQSYNPLVGLRYGVCPYVHEVCHAGRLSSPMDDAGGSGTLRALIADGQSTHPQARAGSYSTPPLPWLSTVGEHVWYGASWRRTCCSADAGATYITARAFVDRDADDAGWRTTASSRSAWPSAQSPGGNTPSTPPSCRKATRWS